MRTAFILAGQSNASGTSPLINTRDDREPAPYVPIWARTDINEWTGAATASADSGYQYRYPTAETHPCLYNENVVGEMDRVFDTWGEYDKQYPGYPTGDLTEAGSYGLELSFLQKFRQTYPNTPLAFVKQSLGGTSLRSDWLPNIVTLDTAQAGGATSITLASGDFGTSQAYVGRVMRITGGTGSGSTGTVTAFDSGTKVATLSGGWSGAAPTSGSTYGIERTQLQILRVMIEQASARLNTSEGSGNWRWGAFIWMQGESGAHALNPDDSQYLSDARALFAFIRTITSTPTLPVLIGLIGDNWLNTNPSLIAAGAPYTAIDYSITASGQSVTDQRRADCLAGAYTRRATQTTLGADANCKSWNNDGYPVRPPLALTAAENDETGYHWGGPGYMAAGERAFAAYQSLAAPRRKLRLRTATGSLTLQAGAV